MSKWTIAIMCVAIEAKIIPRVLGCVFLPQLVMNADEMDPSSTAADDGILYGRAESNITIIPTLIVRTEG